MPMRQIFKIPAAGTAFVVIVVLGMSIGSRPGQAKNDNNGSQDEQQMIQTGLAIAATTGIHLNIDNKDSDMVGLGSYLVNVAADCNGCHSNPITTYAPGGDPYLLPGPVPPFFNGKKQINPATYLGGNQDFGVFGPGPQGHIISRNLTPDKTGLPEGGHTLSDFIQILKTGVDLDQIGRAHV